MLPHSGDIGQTPLMPANAITIRFFEFSDSGPTESEASEPDISVVEPLVQKTLYSSVSITPVTSLHSSYPNITLERRPGIEIIAVNKDNSVGVPSSLTITPIPSSSEKDHEKKERKRRREDGERMANSNGGGKPAKMLGLGTTVMGPPGLSKQEVINSKVGLAINPSATSPSKHPSSGGKPSLLALKCKLTPEKFVSQLSLIEPSFTF